MKTIVIAAAAVGATVAGLILSYQKKIERRRQLSRHNFRERTEIPEEVAPPLAIQAIP